MTTIVHVSYLEGRTHKLGAEFTLRYEDVHRCNRKILEFIAGKKVVWLVLDNNFSFTQDKTDLDFFALHALSFMLCHLYPYAQSSRASQPSTAFVVGSGEGVSHGYIL